MRKFIHSRSSQAQHDNRALNVLLYVSPLAVECETRPFICRNHATNTSTDVQRSTHERSHTFDFTVCNMFVVVKSSKLPDQFATVRII